MNIISKVSPKDQHFGGSWTEEKIEMVQKYLSAYTVALKNQSFQLVYIDAFAGTGHYYIKDENEDLIQMDGSAKVALELERPFHSYYFIDKDNSKLGELEKLACCYDHLQGDVHFRSGDANTVICELCGSIDWSSNRAVMFLDPFGLQVDWNTIQTIARTKCVDLWFLFPIFAINRMLKKNGNISDEWTAKLNNVLGSNDWYDHFYKKSRQRTLFGDARFNKCANFDKITAYIVERLGEEFAAVHKKPRIFTTSTNSPLFALCFAIGSENERAIKLALKIAGNILSKR